VSAYVLLRAPDATVLASRPVLLAADAVAAESLPDLLDALREERATLQTSRERTIEAARAEGFAVGRAEGEAAAREEAGRALADTLAGLRAERQEAREAACDLALKIARRVLPEAAGTGLLPGLVATAAEELAEEEPHAVRAHPDDLPLLSDLLRDTGLAGVADASLGPGAIIVETRAGAAQAGLEARLGALAEALRG
jgi:flagellar assembly protein FliH